MGGLKALSLAGIVMLGGAAVAHAADLLPPVPQLMPDNGPSESSGWYLRGDVGVGDASLRSVTSSDAAESGFAIDESHLDDSAFAGVGAGYQFNNWLRADITGEYRTSQRFQSIESYTFLDSQSGLQYTGFDTYNGSIQSSVLLANGYVDLGHWYGWTPYLGGGIGVAYNRVASLTDVGAGSTDPSGQGNGGLGWAPTKATSALAWALMAGMSFDVTPNLKLDVNYRYLNMGNAISGPIICTNMQGCSHETQKYQLASNDIRVGLRWMLGEAEAPAPQPPIVTKY
jgi:opacity protein-like surface antigen